MRNSLTGALAAVMLVIPVTLYAASAGTPPDTMQTTATGVPAGASPRGTVSPLERGASTLDYAGRAMLLVPYAATRTVTLPMEWLTFINEKHRIVERGSALLFRKYGDGKTVIGTFFGYESGVGFSLAGLTSRTDDFLFPGALLEAKGGYLSPDNNRISARFRTAPDNVQLHFMGRFENKQNRPFYGLGPDAPDESSYSNVRRFAAEGGITLRPWRGLSTTLLGFVHNNDLSFPESGEAAKNLFPDLYAVAEKSHYAGAEISAAYDSRNNGAFSSKGGLLRIAGGVDRARSADDADYEHYGVETQGFLNLFHHTRILAFRAFAEGLQTDDPGMVPYTEMEHLGGKYGLRGYSRDRFTGRKMLQLAAEYRYRLTEHVFGSVFGDWGAVSDEWEDLHPNDLESAYGFGLLFGSYGDRYAISIAKGREEIAFYLGLERIFSTRSRRLR